MRNDELMHWKYIKREKVNGKWKYTYTDDKLNRAKETFAKTSKEHDSAADASKKAKSAYESAREKADAKNVVARGRRLVDSKLIGLRATSEAAAKREVDATIANTKAANEYVNAKEKYDKSVGLKVADKLNDISDKRAENKAERERKAENREAARDLKKQARETERAQKQAERAKENENEQIIKDLEQQLKDTKKAQKQAEKEQKAANRQAVKDLEKQAREKQRENRKNKDGYTTIQDILGYDERDALNKAEAGKKASAAYDEFKNTPLGIIYRAESTIDDGRYAVGKILEKWAEKLKTPKASTYK